MSNIWRTAILLAALAFAAPALAEDNPILQRLQVYVAAYNAHDVAAITGFYTEDGAVLPQQGDVIIGRKPIAAHYAQAFAGVSELKYNVLEIRQAGPTTAVEIAATQFRVGAQTLLGRSLHVWTLQDGVWSISRDMYQILGVSK